MLWLIVVQLISLAISACCFGMNIEKGNTIGASITMAGMLICGACALLSFVRDSK